MDITAATDEEIRDWVGFFPVSSLPDTCHAADAWAFIARIRVEQALVSGGWVRLREAEARAARLEAALREVLAVAEMGVSYPENWPQFTNARNALSGQEG
jgi:hypothetical protein